MAIKVLVNGAFGRMGQITAKAIAAHPNLELVGETGREYDLAKSIQDSKAQVVVDFTSPESVFANTTTILQAGAHPVIGTTGLTVEQVKQLQTVANKAQIGGVIAPNFSLGAVLMLKYAREIMKYMPSVEIIELHHQEKADSPSGTAVRTAELLADVNMKNPYPPKDGKETIKGARGANHRGIPIHSIRLPGFLAHEQIIFGNIGETLTIKHDSIDRDCFMPGVCLACEKAATMNKLIYGLEEIL